MSELRPRRVRGPIPTAGRLEGHPPAEQGSFGRTAWMVTAVHVAVVGGFLAWGMWHREKPRENVVWLMGGEMGTPGEESEAGAGEEMTLEAAPATPELEMIVVPEPVIDPVVEPEAEPLPPLPVEEPVAPVASELVVPRATPPPATPVPQVTPKPTPKPTPPPTPKATPKPTPATPKPTPATPKPTPKATPKTTPKATPKTTPGITPKVVATPKPAATPAASSMKVAEKPKSSPAPKASPAKATGDAATAGADLSGAGAAGATKGAGSGGKASTTSGPRGSGGTGTAGTGKGAGGTGTGPGSGAGSQNGWYLSMIQERFYGAWQQPTSIVRSAQKFSTKLKIRIGKDGQIQRREIVAPSGNSIMDESVQQAAEQVTQIDALPAGLGNGEYFDISIDFRLDQD